jgi:histidyl-tRNA synthetase
LKTTAVKGFNDILPFDSPKWQYLESIAREIFHVYGYAETRLPILEKTEVFTRSIGEATDIVEKEMYSFLDKNGASLTLRPEGTAPVVRAFVQNTLYSKNPVNKLYYMGPMFRYERPQKGRYRQFHQIGAEVFGALEPEIDAEMLSMLMHFLKKINLSGLVLEINSLGCESCRGEYKKALVEYFSRSRESLCENCARRIELNPLRILDCKAASCKELKKDAPLISKYLCNECSSHFEDVKKSLKDLNEPFTVNERMVRGLDYYTKTTFEVTSNMLGSQNAVAAGGRYDNLCEQFGGPKMPAIGFALGVERLILLLDENTDYKNKPHVFIAAIGEKAKKESFKIIDKLRKKNISCEMEYADKSLKSQMRRSDKSGYKYVLIIGDEELKNGEATMRDMSTKEQRSIPLNNIVDEIADCCLPK